MDHPESSAGGRCVPHCATCARLRRAAVALAGSGGLEGLAPEAIARAARLPASALEAHACGDVGVCVRTAYQELVEALQVRFAACMRAADTSEDGLRDATADLLAYLGDHPNVAAFLTTEVLKGDRAVHALRERMRLQSVANVRRELARFAGGAAVPELQIEMFLATMGQTIAQHVNRGHTADLAEAIEPALALADACAPLPALG
jgi:hypothetical protein